MLVRTHFCYLREVLARTNTRTQGVQNVMQQAFPFYCTNPKTGIFLRNYNYGVVGEALKVDLLSHPEYIEQNATLAFQAAIWRWMTPIKKYQPSAHDAFVGNWKPTKNDTMENRVPGFGTTMNILYGDGVCGQGDVDTMNNIVSHYMYYLDLLGVGREEAGPHELLTYVEQVPFNPSSKAVSST